MQPSKGVLGPASGPTRCEVGLWCRAAVGGRVREGEGALQGSEPRAIDSGRNLEDGLMTSLELLLGP